MIKHILFDCDGVLVDTEISAAKVMVEALGELGIEITLDYYLHHLAGSTFTTIINKYLGDSLIGKAREMFLDKAEQKTVEQVDAIANVEWLLSSLELPKSIVSNSHIWHVKHVTEKAGIEHYFTEHIFSSELVSNPKPFPDVYNLAQSKLELNSHELIAIEDSSTGVRAAVASGITVIGFGGASHILPGHTEKLLDLGATEVAQDMNELKNILNKYLKN